MEQIQATVIGTGDGMPQNGTTVEATTPHGVPDVAVRFIRPIVAILVRFINTYLVTLSGIVVGGMSQGAANTIMPYHDFQDLVMKAALLAVSVPVLGAIKDSATIFGKLETKYPLLTGSV